MEKITFIEFLDAFKSKQEVLNYEYLKFIQNVNADFYSNNYSNPQMVGYCPSIQETNKYNQWMQKNQVQLKIEDDRPEKFIDANIHTISDLIKLIDNNQYDDDYKYNIDFRSLERYRLMPTYFLIDLCYNQSLPIPFQEQHTYLYLLLQI